MLEVHYNNQNKEKGCWKHTHSSKSTRLDLKRAFLSCAGLIDQSGMRLSVTSDLRPFDAGILELGLIYTDRMAIPPGVKGFPLTGHCSTECTQAVSLESKCLGLRAKP